MGFQEQRPVHSVQRLARMPTARFRIDQRNNGEWVGLLFFNGLFVLRLLSGIERDQSLSIAFGNGDDVGLLKVVAEDNGLHIPSRRQGSAAQVQFSLPGALCGQGVECVTCDVAKTFVDGVALQLPEHLTERLRNAG